MSGAPRRPRNRSIDALRAEEKRMNESTGGAMRFARCAVALVAVLSLMPHTVATEREQGAVALKQTDTAVEVTVDGKPFTTYRFAAAADDPKFVRPYFYPVLAADGTA